MFCEKGVLENFTKFTENTCVRVSFLTCNFIKKENLALVFSCESCEIFKNTFFTEHLRTIASPSTLIYFRKNNIDNIESPISNDIWVELWKLQVDQQGPRKTVTSCKAKLKTLTDAYKKAKGNNKKTGRASVTCPFTII